jgi:hypothetical protein
MPDMNTDFSEADGEQSAAILNITNLVNKMTGRIADKPLDEQASAIHTGSASTIQILTDLIDKPITPKGDALATSSTSDSKTEA